MAERLDPLDALDHDIEAGRISLDEYWRRRGEIEAAAARPAPDLADEHVQGDPFPGEPFAAEAADPADPDRVEAPPSVVPPAPPPRWVRPAPAPPRGVGRQDPHGLDERVAPWLAEGDGTEAPEDAGSSGVTETAGDRWDGTGELDDGWGGGEVHGPREAAGDRSEDARPPRTSSAPPDSHQAFLPPSGAVNLDPQRPTPVTDGPRRRLFRRRPRR